MENDIERKISGLAVTTFAFSIISYYILPILELINPLFYVTPVIFIIIGFYSLRDIKKNNKKGKWFAIVGIIINIILLLILPVLYLIFGAGNSIFS